MSHSRFRFTVWTILILICVVGGIQLSGSFVGEADPLYHFHSAALFLANNINFNLFSWLPFTMVGKYGADLWWGYHVIISPFTVLFSGIVGIKIAIVFFAAIFLGLIAVLLHAMKVRWTPACLIFLMFASGDFLFRWNVLRPHVLASTFLIFGVWVIWEKRFWLLVPIAFFWSIIEPSAVVLLVTVLLFTLIADNQSFPKRLLPSAYVLGGIFLGTVLHPAFPKNLYLIASQYRALLLPFQGIMLGIGQELQSYKPEILINTTGLAALLWVVFLVAAIHFWIKQKKISRQHLWLMVLSVVSFLAMIRARRFIDYWLPLATIFCAYTLGKFYPDVSWNDFWVPLKKFWQMRVAMVIALIIGVAIGYHNISYVVSALKNSADPFKYAQAAEWLKTNSERGSIVFNPQWDQFPQLFYWDDKNYYIAGMDPTFLYEHNHDFYWQWRKISDDDPAQWGSETIKGIVKDQFHAAYVFVEDSRNPNLQNYLQNNQDFTLVYQDPVIHLYQVK